MQFHIFTKTAWLYLWYNFANAYLPYHLKILDISLPFSYKIKKRASNIIFL